MVHELEHVQRRDWVNSCLARTVCAVYWFHPLVWIAWRQLTLEAERACDDAVLGRSEATAYADQLVGLAQRLSRTSKLPLLAMANRAELGKRVGAVLDSGQRRGRAGVFAVALACAAAAVVVVTMSPLRMVAAPQAAMPRFSSTTMLVIERVAVFDQGGRTVDGLSAGDFALSEDGKPQRISAFEFEELGPTPGTPGSMSSYYVLGYYTTNPNMDGEFRNIRVRLPGDTTSTVRSRMGYSAGRARGVVESSAAVPGQSAPIPIFSPEAEYADEARKAKFQGTVTLTVQVEPSGQVTNINVTRRLGLGLDEKAVEAVRRWRFKPGTMGGQPVPVLGEVEVNFRLL
jgi:TonB family protein